MSASTFQDAKDTFYLTLRDRLTALYPDRTVVVRGTTRAGILVEENEMPDGTEEALQDGFVLRWTGYSVDASEAVPLERGHCEIRYRSRGMAELAGMNRGRALQAMDEELLSMLQPASAPLLSFAGAAAGAPRTGAARVFWSDPEFGVVAVSADAVERTAMLEVFAWKEEL